MAGQIHYWIADWNLSRAEAAMLLGNDVWDMVDCTGSNLDKCKSAFPHVTHFGAYLTGTGGVAWSGAQIVEMQRKGAHLIFIDQTDRDLPLFGDIFLVKDVEPGASHPDMAARVAQERLKHGEDYWIYVDRSELPAVEAAIHGRGLPHGTVRGYQWASPSSNPNTPLPGLAGLSLHQANADLSVFHRDAPLPPPKPPKPPVHPPVNPGAHEFDKALVTFDHTTGHWAIHGVPRNTHV